MKNTNNNIIIEDCIAARGTRENPKCIKNRHYRMDEEKLLCLESKKDINGNEMGPLSARECQIIDVTTGEYYTSIKQLNNVIAPDVPYQQFYYLFQPVLRDKVPFGGHIYAYADSYTKDQLENIELQAKINSLNSIIIEIRGTMQHLHELAELSDVKMKDVSTLVDKIKK